VLSRAVHTVTGLYLASAAAGLPLVLWSLVGHHHGDHGAGHGDAGHGHDAGDDAPGHGVGSLMLRLVPLSTLAIAAASFGVGGLALDAAGARPRAALLGALALALLTGAANSAAFSYLRRSESTSSVDDDRLVGAVGKVVLPFQGRARGRVAITIDGQHLYLSAVAPLAGPEDESSSFSVGDPVLVIDHRNGIAEVVRLDPELA
jgi:membrane protein implicated in regulation of membrane protease activity